MTHALVHRGPDDEGLHLGPEIGLGFRRLSIIDLESGGQPVASEDGSVVAVFNGEIYNYLSLREGLLQRGHKLRARGDAEVLPHLYEELGDDLVDELRGMFAFAIWDAPRRRLLVARDRAGEKPLYYAPGLPRGGLGFASEIKALLDGGASREPNRRALVEYLYHLYVPPPRTAFASVEQLPPAHRLVFEDGRVEVTRYWAPSFATAARTEDEHVEGLREQVHDAVSSRLVADVPVGAFLSGGIDSSSVVAAMKAAHEGPVHTFTITFEGHDHYDESAQARRTARYLGTEHHELRASLEGPAALPTMVQGFDQPFGNPTALLVSSLSEATREHVKVVLTGDGADELFCGYPRYRGLVWAGRYHRVAPATVRAMAARASELLPESTSGWHTARRAREFLSGGTRSPVEAYLEWIGYFTPDLLRECLVPDLQAEGERSSAFLRGLFSDCGASGLNAVSCVELGSFLPCNVLEYADRMSMAHGLELRAPFVDHQLVEYVASMPARLKLRNGRTKWALRRALADELPDEVLTRRKRGLNPPLGAWLAGAAAPLMDEMLSPRAVRQRGLLEPSAVARLIAQQRSGRRDRSLHLWALLVLETWFRVRVDA